MSQRTTLKKNLLAASARLGGAHLTREARDRTVRRLAETLTSLGYTHLRDATDICGRHLRDYLQSRSDKSRRTTQNEMSHIRTILRHAGRASIADAPELTNKALGIGGAARVGSKTAMTFGEMRDACQRAEERSRPGLSIILQLGWYLGLRANEAVHARLDTLQRWQKELRESGSIEVLAGTKGGRRRTVRVLDRESAMQALLGAEQVAAAQGGYLVTRANGSPAGSLQAARAILHSWSQRCGIQLHAARYAFAQHQLQGYVLSGMSVREALSAVSLDLGHGSARGRWVKSVYSR